MNGPKLLVGGIVKNVLNFHETMATLEELRFEFICTSIAMTSTAEGKKTLDPFPDSIVEPISVEDIAVPRNSEDLSKGVVGRISNLHQELCSSDMNERRAAVTRIRQEIQLCDYYKLNAIMVEATCDGDVFNVAEVVYSTLPETSCKVLVRVPMTLRNDNKDPACHDKSLQPSSSGWSCWNQFRSTCSGHPRLALALELPKASVGDEELNRWMCEPIDCLILRNEYFNENENGELELASECLETFRRFFSSNMKVMVDFNEELDSKHTTYRNVLIKLFKTWRNSYKINEKKEQSDVPDYPYAPRQPIVRDSKCRTYEKLEKDETKYEKYQEALEKALVTNFCKLDDPVNILVPGAGRGALVDAVVRALSNLKKKAYIVAVEKNQFIKHWLLQRCMTWKSAGYNVETVYEDMRRFKSERKFDIIVADIFGCFGCDMLSPELLDSVQIHLKDGGVMIPKMYQSYLGPIMNPTLYNNLQGLKNIALLESMCLVELVKKYEIDLPQPLLRYDHPNPVSKDTNDRCEELVFYPCVDTVLHGFAGYFETALFEGVSLSTVATRPTPGLTSWLSAFFPLKYPVTLKAGESFRLRFRRCSSEYYVWNEWSVTTQTLRVSSHNVSGNCYKVML